jgi:hypothetical protein
VNEHDKNAENRVLAGLKDFKFRIFKHNTLSQDCEEHLERGREIAQLLNTSETTKMILQKIVETLPQCLHIDAMEAFANRIKTFDELATLIKSRQFLLTGKKKNNFN